MAFGKRSIEKSPLRSASYGRRSAPMAAPLDSSGLSRLLVISVIGIVALAAMTTVVVSFLQTSRSETMQVDATLVDGSPTPTLAQDRLVGACVELGVMTLTRGGSPSEEERQRTDAACQCAFGKLAAELTPLQVQMLYVDQRTRLRALLADIDQTGERIEVGSMPRIEKRENAPIAVVTAAYYEAQWRQARALAAQPPSCTP